MEEKQLVGKRYSRRKADGGEAAGREEIQQKESRWRRSSMVGKRYSRRKADEGEAAGREEIQ